tara:strand:- start:9454 stop:12276 length:2823 start_codon:yes stop_codon:yes gene_type:complete
MAYVKYESEFYSLNPATPDSRFKVRIHKKTGSGSTTNFNLGSDGFVLTMDGGDDTMLAPIKTTSCEFTFFIEDGDTDQEEIIDDILSVAGSNEDELALEIQRYQSGIGYRRYWIGVILGDLSELEDRSPHNKIRIRAVDGLSQLKYKTFRTSQQGNRSCLYYIKAGLNEITTSFNDFGFWTEDNAETENFLTHEAFYYNKAMGNISSSTWRDDLDHDPLALTKINSIAFKGTDGQYWSYYKIIENIISAFQLRLMMTPIRDDSSSSGGSFYNGNCTWLLQSPLAYHESSNNTDRKLFGHKFFLHGKDLSTDVALAYEDIMHTVYNPEEVLAGAKVVFTPPLLSYKSIYDHSNFLGLGLGPAVFMSNWNYGTGTGGNINNNTSSGYHSFSTDNTNTINYPLTNITNQSIYGWVGSDNQLSSGCRIAITGNCTVYPKNHSFVASSGIVGYDSAGEYFEYYGGTSLGNGWYGIYDTAVVMPRLALKVETLIADPAGSETIPGGDGATYRRDAFWLGDRRFGTLAGSTNWGYRQTGDYPDYNEVMGADEDYQYPKNLYGFDNSFDGTRFWPDYYNTTTYIVDGIQQWGTDIGYSEYYWWRTSGEDPGDQSVYTEKNHAFFAPIYHQSNVEIRNGSTSSSTWDGDVWDMECEDWVHSDTFVVLSPRIPAGTPAGGGSAGANYIRRIILYALIRCDDATTPGGVQQVAACKSWDYSSLDTGGATSGGFGCEARGLQWDYYLSDLRINITGINAGVDSFDYTVACYENTNGTPSEQYVQEPEIIIGDTPPADPYAWTEDTGDAGFGGQYPGEFKICTEANSTNSPETGSDTQNWRAFWEVGATVAGSRLHEQRVKNALAHYYMPKRGLQLTFQDRTNTKELEQKLASGLYYWASNTKWGENQLGVNIAYLVNGFTFVAGTGEITLDLEDCVTFSRSGLVDKSYSSNG